MTCAPCFFNGGEPSLGQARTNPAIEPLRALFEQLPGLLLELFGPAVCSFHGDFASSIALRLAKAARRNPRQLAQTIVTALPASDLVANAEVAGAGFINFHLAPTAYARELERIANEGERYGRSDLGNGTRVIVEFVSSNPTGPLHVGHGRHAAYGATLSNLLSATGFKVHREYYVNDAGRQMDILAASVWLRYLELGGERFEFPSNGYRGEYLLPIAQKLLYAEQRRLQRAAAEVFQDLPPDAPAGDKDAYIDAVIARARALLGAEDFRRVLDLSLGEILADMGIAAGHSGPAQMI